MQCPDRNFLARHGSRPVLCHNGKTATIVTYDECDGVLQVNQPVLLEIRNRLGKADTVK